MRDGVLPFSAAPDGGIVRQAAVAQSLRRPLISADTASGVGCPARRHHRVAGDAARIARVPQRDTLRSVSSVGTFIRPVTAAKTYHTDGTTTTVKAPAVWTLAHRGYSGCGRLDIWAYPTKRAALLAGADLALACGLVEDERAVALYHAGRLEAVLARYEETSPPDHLLRVQAAFLQGDQDTTA